MLLSAGFTPEAENQGSLIIEFNDPNDSYIREVIFGSLLGDGHLEMAARSKNARFIFSQSLKYEEYFLFLYSMFSVYRSNTFQKYEYLDKRTNKIYVTYSFKTKSLPLFTEFYTMFYNDKTKIVPLDLNLLTPVALANLICQDGSFSTSKGIYLCTDSFNPLDVKRLAEYLSIKFKIICTTPKAPGMLGYKGHLRIYISAKSVPIVRELVKKYMVPSMLYKIGL